MALIYNWDGPKSFRPLLDLVSRGDATSPRGQPTRELRNVVIEISDPAMAVPLGVGRAMVPGIGAAETAQLIGGLSDVDQLDSVSGGRFRQYTNDGVLLGAYGPRTYEHMPLVIDKLASDPATRQAIVPVWRTSDLERDDQHDVPCTVYNSFAIRDGKLLMSTHMRSNDAWYGLPYDLWMFTRVQLTVARVLGVSPGTYTHVVDSFHLYERDTEKVDRLHDPRTAAQPPLIGPTGTDTRPGLRSATQAVKRWNLTRLEAQNAVLGRYVAKLSDGGKWYADVLRDHTSGNVVCNDCRYVMDRSVFTRATSGSRMSVCTSCSRKRYGLRTQEDPRAGLRLRLRKYGMTLNEYDDAVADLDGRCPGCDEPPSSGRYGDFVLDHDHATGLFRGLLCSNCNVAVGMAADSAKTLRSLAGYLDRWEARRDA